MIRVCQICFIIYTCHNSNKRSVLIRFILTRKAIMSVVESYFTKNWTDNLKKISFLSVTLYSYYLRYGPRCSDVEASSVRNILLWNFVKSKIQAESARLQDAVEDTWSWVERSNWKFHEFYSSPYIIRVINQGSCDEWSVWYEWELREVDTGLWLKNLKENVQLKDL